MAGKSKKPMTLKKFEGSSADTKMDKGRPKGWEGSKADYALDKKGVAKANRGKKC